MKILTIIALIGSILSPIKSDRYKNSFNDTGSSSFNSFVQVTYEYYCEEPSYTVGLSAGVISGETQIPLIYSIKLNIKLRDPVESAYIKLNFTSPLGTSPYWEIPALCENATIGYVDDNDLYVYLYNTDYASIYIVYTYEQVMKRYGYQYIGQINALDPMSPEWIENGYTYCDLLSVTLSSATLSTSPNYSSQLNSIMSYTDGIENYLSQIVTNTSYISTISTNINTIKTTLNNIYTLINSMSTSVSNQSYLFKNTNGIMCSIDNTVKNIGYMFSGNYEEYLSNDFVTHGSGPSAPTYATVYDPANNINSNYNKNKIKIVIKINTNTDNTYYYFNVPLNDSNTIIQSTETLMTYNVNSQLFNRITITFYVSNNFIGFNIAAWQTSPNGQFGPSSSTWTVVNNCFSTDANISTEEILYSIEELLSNMSGNVNIDTSDKTAVDNWYDQLEQSLDFPLVDREQLTQGFQKMGKIIKYYGMLINNSEWVLLPKIILISAMFKLFGVIIS